MIPLTQAPSPWTAPPHQCPSQTVSLYASLGVHSLKDSYLDLIQVFALHHIANWTQPDLKFLDSPLRRPLNESQGFVRFRTATKGVSAPLPENWTDSDAPDDHFWTEPSVPKRRPVDQFSLFRNFCSSVLLCLLTAFLFYKVLIALAIMISMVECTRFASLNTSKLGSDDTKTATSDYLISGEVDGKEVQWGPGDWMRPLGQVEMMFCIGGYLKSLNTVQAIWISSEQPLTRHIMMEALQHLVQRIPILNVCIQRRGSQIWYRRVQKTVIDFDIVQGDTMKIFHEVQAGTYELSKGPMWRARMVQLPPGEESPRGVVAKNHAMVVFGVQHSITDATTNLILCKELVSILNDMLRGRPISSQAYPLGSPHAEKLVDSSRGYLMKYFCRRFFNILVLDFNKKTTFRGLLPLPKNFVVETRILNHVFTEEITKKLITKCKENGTTVHSCIVTVANAAYFDIACEKTKDKVDKVNMYFTDSINLRRYYPENEREYIGCHITMHEQKTVISTDSKANFWSTARCSKAALHEDLSGKNCLKVIPIIKWAAIVFPFNIYRNRKGSVNITDSHYITTNMGDVTKMVGESAPEDPVQINDIFRSANGEQAGHLFTLTCHTFRKRFYLSIDYYGNKMKDSHAEEFFNDMRQKLENLAEKGTLS